MNSTPIKPIFVRGMSRSGGTLMCTLLDAHPDISFSFELYPNLLLLETNTDEEALANTLYKSKTLKAAASIAPTPRFATFLNRLPRGGLTIQDFSKVYSQALNEGGSLTDLKCCMRVMQLCCEIKQKRDKTSRWGLKCNGRIDDYLEMWPNAQFIDVMRDGRDVFASQKNTGSFAPEATALAKAWVNTHKKFIKLSITHPNQVMIVRYEDLTHMPEKYAKDICTFLDVPHRPEMLEFHKMNLTVFNTTHLSLDRISTQIDTTKVERWKNELSETEASEFMAIAGDMMAEWGYEN